jgi:alkylresorcinol/alkylpyrone synthase
MRIQSVGRALPAHRHTQDEIRAMLADLWADQPSIVARLPKLYENTRVHQRHLALPLDAYRSLDTFGRSNDAWIQASLALGQEAIEDALAQAGLTPADVDALFTVSVTGVASPALDARLMNRMPLRPDMKRIPIFGLGCVAGVAGIARAADYVRAFPDQVAVLLSVELCSLTFQRHDLSLAHVLSAGLFGDGAAAVVVVGEERAQKLAQQGPRVVATRSVFYPNTEDAMGWHISEHGFGLILSPEVPELARTRLAPDVDRFLADQGHSRADIDRWVCHPGGPKVLQAMQEGLDLTEDAVALSWEMLGAQGNLSSTSVLMVLLETLARRGLAAGERGLLLAMGPAFCSELVLIEGQGRRADARSHVPAMRGPL